MPAKTSTAPAPATTPQPESRTVRVSGTKRNPVHILTFHEPDEPAMLRAIRLVLERD